jgi:uncharacterized protein (DUF3084 family)
MAVAERLIERKDAEIELYELKLKKWAEKAKAVMAEGEVGWGESYIDKAIEKAARAAAAEQEVERVTEKARMLQSDLTAKTNQYVLASEERHSLRQGQKNALENLKEALESLNESLQERDQLREKMLFIHKNAIQLLASVDAAIEERK